MPAPAPAPIQTLVVLAVAVLALTTVGILLARPWDPHLSSGEAERALAERMRTGERAVECDGLNTNDGSLSLDDVDYECRVGRSEQPIWIGTDDSRITELAAGGP